MAEAALKINKGDSVAIAFVAETTGLLGAALKSSPNHSESQDIFEYPGVRQWLSFYPERAHPRSLCLVVGIATKKSDSNILSEFLRPLGGDTFGHFHAAAFPYRPLSREITGLTETISSLFEKEKPLGILHLIRDAQLGESEFERGLVWVGKITSIERENSR
ncbi:MAG TPA: hypothetical protein DD435_04275 [Cyanobacteria bacterium UBA8530]|nr:hypothetical protein [Cyanobacteria bacterium UBA8530]